MNVTRYCSARTKEGRSCSSVATSTGLCPAHKMPAAPAPVIHVPAPVTAAAKPIDPVTRLRGRKVEIHLDGGSHVVGTLLEAWPFELVLQVAGGSEDHPLAGPGRRIFLKHAVVAVEEIP